MAFIVENWVEERQVNAQEMKNIFNFFLPPFVLFFLWFPAIYLNVDSCGQRRGKEAAAKNSKFSNIDGSTSEKMGKM